MTTFHSAWWSSKILVTIYEDLHKHKGQSRRTILMFFELVTPDILASGRHDRPTSPKHTASIKIVSRPSCVSKVARPNFARPGRKGERKRENLTLEASFPLRPQPSYRRSVPGGLGG